MVMNGLTICPRPKSSIGTLGTNLKGKNVATCFENKHTTTLNRASKNSMSSSDAARSVLTDVGFLGDFAVSMYPVARSLSASVLMNSFVFHRPSRVAHFHWAHIIWTSTLYMNSTAPKFPIFTNGDASSTTQVDRSGFPRGYHQISQSQLTHLAPHSVHMHCHRVTTYSLKLFQHSRSSRDVCHWLFSLQPQLPVRIGTQPHSLEPSCSLCQHHFNQLPFNGCPLSPSTIHRSLHLSTIFLVVCPGLLVPLSSGSQPQHSVTVPVKISVQFNTRHPGSLHDTRCFVFSVIRFRNCHFQHLQHQRVSRFPAICGFTWLTRTVSALCRHAVDISSTSWPYGSFGSVSLENL